MWIFVCLFSGFWGQSQGAKHQSHFLTSRDAVKQPDSTGQTPFTDHWSISHPPVSLRDIMKEEQALENVQKVLKDPFQSLAFLIFFFTLIVYFRADKVA